MYVALLRPPGAGESSTRGQPAAVRVGRVRPSRSEVHALGSRTEFGCIILEGYGLSETSPVASFNHPGRVRKPGSIGTADRGGGDDAAATSSDGVGEIAIRGHNVMKGYWGQPGRDRRGDRRRRLVPHRRPGQRGRGRLLLHRRPQEGHDHPRRLQRLPARDRGGALRAPGGARGGRHRHQHPELGEEVCGRGRTEGGRHGHPRANCASTSRRRPRRTSTRGTCGSSTELPKTPTGKILKREVTPPGPS